VVIVVLSPHEGQNAIRSARVEDIDVGQPILVREVGKQAQQGARGRKA
jgi:hypothetical protein